MWVRLVTGLPIILLDEECTSQLCAHLKAGLGLQTDGPYRQWRVGLAQSRGNIYGILPNEIYLRRISCSCSPHTHTTQQQD